MPSFQEILQKVSQTQTFAGKVHIYCTQGATQGAWETVTVHIDKTFPNTNMTLKVASHRGSNMATATEVLSFLRILTSNDSKATPAEEREEFDEVLLSNMERLKDALCKRGRFPQLEKHFENRGNGDAFCETAEICKKGNLENLNEANDLKTVKVDLTTSKDEIRWTFVEMCLELLKLLKESLVSLLAKSDQTAKEKVEKRGNENPLLPADSLGVHDQKTVLTAIQFVVILGICPNLVSGVGLPVEMRSGFAAALNIHCSVKSERRLFECVNTLVDCIAQRTLGALILSRHLGDILSGLLQICYRPISSYSNVNSRKLDLTSLKHDQRVTTISGSFGNNVDEASKNPPDVSKDDLVIKPLMEHSSCDQLQPSDLYMLTPEPPHMTRDDNQKLFITSSERELCAQNLQRILDRVYQPTVIRELLMLQKGPVSVGKRPIKNNSERKLSGDNATSTGNQGMKDSVSPLQTPKWMKIVCGQLLSERLMKPNGVKAVLLAFLEGSAGINEGVCEKRK